MLAPSWMGVPGTITAGACHDQGPVATGAVGFRYARPAWLGLERGRGEPPPVTVLLLHQAASLQLGKRLADRLDVDRATGRRPGGDRLG